MTETKAPEAKSVVPSPAQAFSKRVTFTCVDGIWNVEVDVTDPRNGLSEKDFNILQRTLQAKRPYIRQLAFQAYQKLMREQAEKPTTKS